MSFAYEANTVIPRSVSISGTATTTSTVTGNVAHSTAVSGNPVRIGGKVLGSTVDTTLVAGDVCDAGFTTSGSLIIKPYGPGELDWSYTGVLTTTTVTAASAAGGASVRNYVTGIQFINSAAVAGALQILDGATLIWQIYVPASMSDAIAITFPTPLRGTAATALNVQATIASMSVYTNIQGFKAF